MWAALRQLPFDPLRRFDTAAFNCVGANGLVSIKLRGPFAAHL